MFFLSQKLQNLTKKIINFPFVAFKPNDSISRVDCKTSSPQNHEPCKINLNAFEPCTSARRFGYEQGRPCIFLKLNKIYNWLPDYFNKSTDSMPQKMPDKLKKHIETREKSSKSTNVVWVSCEGENPADIENLGNDVSYYSLSGEQGFLGTYFPFMSSAGYLQPLVAVQFSSVKSKCFKFILKLSKTHI